MSKRRLDHSITALQMTGGRQRSADCSTVARWCPLCTELTLTTTTTTTTQEEHGQWCRRLRTWSHWRSCRRSAPVHETDEQIHPPVSANHDKDYYCNDNNYSNTAARLIFKACRRDHIQPLLRRLHWPRMPERISFRLAVLVYRCLHGSAPGYLASDLQRVSHLNARRRLRSSTTSALVVARTLRSTIGDRTFPATAASVWNSLPESVRSSKSLQVFHSRLKTELFACSYSHD